MLMFCTEFTCNLFSIDAISQQKLKMDEYRTVQSFVSDIQLLLNNAKTFYMHSRHWREPSIGASRNMSERLAQVSLVSPLPVGNRVWEL